MRRTLLVAARLCATAPATVVSNGAAYADLKRCARAYARAAPVVVTSADTTYLRFLPAWSAALARWGHDQQVVIALSAGLPQLYAVSGACAVSYASAEARPRVADALPALTGLSKFEVVGQLLRWRFDVLFSEMDVFLARDPVAALPAVARRRRVFAAMDNVVDDTLNIGFFFSASCDRDDFREFSGGKTTKSRYRRAW